MANDNRYRKKGRRGKPPWSDLPTELVELVLQNCNFSDQARVRAVCRRWQSIPRVQPLRQQLPWLMSYHHLDWSGCKLFYLNEKKTYTVNISTMKYYQEKKRVRYIRIHASKSGWLLLSHLVHQSLNTVFLLYSPFTNRMIQLPNLQTGNWISATFSADPTCADCVFFVLDNSVYANRVAASTCRLGDTTWTTHVFPGHFDAIDNVVYSQGLFWCATLYGNLATFSVAQGIWNAVLELPSPLQLLQYDNNLVESNGNLFLVLTSFEDKVRHVFELHRSQMAWIYKEDIGDEVLFLGPTSLSVSTTVAAKLGESGKIHRGFKHRFFSARFKCKFFSARNCNRIDRYPKHYDFPKHYGLHAKKDYCLYKFWIEPPS